MPLDPFTSRSRSSGRRPARPRPSGSRRRSRSPVAGHWIWTGRGRVQRHHEHAWSKLNELVMPLDPVHVQVQIQWPATGETETGRREPEWLLGLAGRRPLDLDLDVDRVHTSSFSFDQAVLVQLGAGPRGEPRPVAGGKQPRRRFAGGTCPAPPLPLRSTPLPPRTRPTSRRRTRRPRTATAIAKKRGLFTPGSERRGRAEGRCRLCLRTDAVAEAVHRSARRTVNLWRARRTHPGEHRPRAPRARRSTCAQPRRQPGRRTKPAAPAGARQAEPVTELAERDR